MTIARIWATASWKDCGPSLVVWWKWKRSNVRRRRTYGWRSRLNSDYKASLQTVAIGVERNLDKSLLTRLANGRCIASERNLMITGLIGSGKSYLASALGRHAFLQGYHTRYLNCGRLWTHLRQARNRDRYEKILLALPKVDVLILNDFGLSKLDAPDRM